MYPNAILFSLVTDRQPRSIATKVAGSPDFSQTTFKLGQTMGGKKSINARSCAELIGDTRLCDLHFPSIDGLHVAVVCSRLGQRAWLHQQVGRFLEDSARQCRTHHWRWLVAIGSAIEPWARRAGELFDVPVTTLGINQPADITIGLADAISRDVAVIAIADRVDAAYVRRGGTIEACLVRRLQSGRPTSTRVAVTHDRHCAGKELIRHGAIGWYCHTGRDSDTERSEPPSIADEPWTEKAGEWLIHCTRGRTANWPDETMRQYRDGILLGDWKAIRRGPLESLIRILRSGRLLASAQTSRHTHPVVCFSSLALQELLAGRCFRSHVGRWDYEPFGIAIRVQAAQQLGIKPVIYGDPSQRSQLSPAERFRFHPVGRTYDWRREAEWRSPTTIDLHALNPSDVRVFAAIDRDVDKRRLPPVPWKLTFAKRT